ncbi:PQQ-dependent sugar dehydrogenase [Halobacteriovorax sp. HLS]|uniref:PQQ-dependent sugar dehydrogenase n=1 Tax=Halobacteriovorax sp. HLS TaxID=2234000 RepID=UPI000FD8D212|nr:PQQ-dependent sugar dehydrogenase [Halobacteriovorax sp. HLS]
MKSIIYILTIFICFNTSAINGSVEVAKVPLSKLKLKEVLNTSGVVWSFSFINSRELLYTIRDGKLFHLNMETNTTTRLSNPNVHAKGQGGLLDVQYYKVRNKFYIYVTFSEKKSDVVTTSLARASFEIIKGIPTTGKWEVLFSANVKSSTSKHFGSRLVRSGDYLFMGIGDRGHREYAQDKNLHNGKILKLTMEGKVQLWSIGHRNPQGMDIDPVSGDLYSCEFGPRGGDELNLVIKGKNYGWPLTTYGSEYWGPSIGTTQMKGMERPIMYWTPSISPSGMAFYTGDKVKQWKNNLFLANLSSRHLRRLVLKDKKVIEQEILLSDFKQRIRHVRSAPDGYLYISTDSGKIIRISYE